MINYIKSNYKVKKIIFDIITFKLKIKDIIISYKMWKVFESIQNGKLNRNLVKKIKKNDMITSYRFYKQYHIEKDFDVTKILNYLKVIALFLNKSNNTSPTINLNKIENIIRLMKASKKKE